MPTPKPNALGRVTCGIVPWAIAPAMPALARSWFWSILFSNCCSWAAATCPVAPSWAFSWLTLTASVGAVPGATLVILLPAASMPAWVTLGPPLIVKPLLSILVLPVVTLSKLALSWVAMLTVLPVWVTRMFLPASMVTVLPAFTRDTLLPETLPALAVVVRLKPAWLMALAISPAVASLPASAAAGATMLPLAAGVSAVVLAFRLPSAALVIVVPSVFTARSYTVAPAPLVLGAMLTLPSLDVTTVLAAAMLVLMLFNAVCNCPPFTASLLFAPIVPSATLVILLPPLFSPSPVRLTAFLPAGAMVMPFAPMVVLSPAALVTVVPVALVLVVLPLLSVVVTPAPLATLFAPMAVLPLVVSSLPVANLLALVPMAMLFSTALPATPVYCPAYAPKARFWLPTMFLPASRPNALLLLPAMSVPEW